MGSAAPEGQGRVAALLSGRKVVSVRRVRYVVEGRVSSDGGAIEFTLGDASVVRLSAAPDGESLNVDPNVWIDPFAPPLSPTNLAFVMHHLEWTEFDVSTEPGFRSIVGNAAAHVLEIRQPNEKIIGIELTFPEAVLRAEVGSDELSVDVVAPPG